MLAFTAKTIILQYRHWYVVAVSLCTGTHSQREREYSKKHKTNNMGIHNTKQSTVKNIKSATCAHIAIQISVLLKSYVHYRCMVIKTLYNRVMYCQYYKGNHRFYGSPYPQIMVILKLYTYLSIVKHGPDVPIWTPFVPNFNCTSPYNTVYRVVLLVSKNTQALSILSQPNSQEDMSQIRHTLNTYLSGCSADLGLCGSSLYQTQCTSTVDTRWLRGEN